MPTPMVIFQFVVTLVASGVLLYGLSCWHQKQMAFFTYLAMAVLFNAMGYFLEVSALTLDGAIISVKVAYLGAPFTGILLYLFSRDYTGKPRLKRSLRNFLLAIGTVFTLAAFVYPWIPLLYNDLTFQTEGLVPHLIVSPGPFYVPFFIYIAVFTVMALYNFCKNFIAEKRYEGAPIFLIGIFLPTIAQIIAFFGLLDGWSPVRLAMTVSTLLLAWFMARYRQAEWQSMGRELVVQDMQDAFVLIDNKGVVLDTNLSAQKYFPGIDRGHKKVKLADLWEFPLVNYQNFGCYKLDFERQGEVLNLKVSTTPLKADGVVTGTCIIINDDTANTLMLQELSRLARRDELTGLNNRATFFRDATYSFDLARRQGYDSGCALMMDIDFFKNVNDTYGHAIGDKVLSFIGSLLIKRFRRTDICGRYGGEELCVWMPSTSLNGAKQVAEEVRTAVEAEVFTVDKVTFNVTISIGIAYMPEALPTNFEDLIKKADFALYEAKHFGRNRVCVYSSVDDLK